VYVKIVQRFLSAVQALINIFFLYTKKAAGTAYHLPAAALAHNLLIISSLTISSARL
jgi:hypothetical protein